jgi:2'-hydroxyisoflavone reductase
MTTRRHFLAQTAIGIAGGALSLSAHAQSAANSRRPGSSKSVTSLRVLILGGTGFIGPYFVRAALERGHKVSVFNRGKTGTELPADIERLVGDRNGDLQSIQYRDWDAVLDMATYEPRWVRTLGEGIRDHVKHYTFVSTTAVYAYDPDATGVETDRLKTYKGAADPFAPIPKMSATESQALSFEQKKQLFDRYGAFQAIAEREAERQFPGTTLILRPHAIIGSGDTTNHVYWLARMLRGGEILAPGSPSDPFQLIDVRDMADWTLRMIEQREVGTYNTFGPAAPLTWGTFLESALAAAGSSGTLTWVPSDWLLKQQVPQMQLPMWFPYPDRPAPGLLEWSSFKLSNQKALQKGLSFHPLEETLADTFAAFRSTPPEVPRGWGMTAQEEAAWLQKWHASLTANVIAQQMWRC